eukprot:SAG25_NODE_21_length_22373_cov_13.904373_31_plen_155_part_00
MLRLRKVDVAQLPLPIVFNLSYVNATAVVVPTGQPDVKKVGHFMIRTEPVTEIPLQFYALDLRFRIARTCYQAAVAPQSQLLVVAEPSLCNVRSRDTGAARGGGRAGAGRRAQRRRRGAYSDQVPHLLILIRNRRCNGWKRRRISATAAVLIMI